MKLGFAQWLLGRMAQPTFEGIMKQYTDRRAAGKILAAALTHYSHNKNTLVLALPRGGVPVAFEVALALVLPLDVFIVRKLGFPGHEEFAMGAIASGDTLFLNENLVQQSQIPKKTIIAIIKSEQKELARREKLYRHNRPFPALKDKTILLIDDGIATGATIKAAIVSLKKHQPGRIILAVPVAAADTIKELVSLVDDIVCPIQPIDFRAVGLWYEQFTQTTDEEVEALLSQSRNITG